MEPLHRVLPAAVAAFIRDAPLSPGKIAVAWKTAVGPAIDRATAVRLAEEGVLEVRVADQHWRREIRRSTPLILDRLTAMLAPGTVTTLKVVHSEPRQPR